MSKPEKFSLCMAILLITLTVTSDRPLPWQLVAGIVAGVLASVLFEKQGAQ